jgi:hypothetical protein
MSIWFTKAFIGAVLHKNGRWMGTLSEEGGDGVVQCVEKVCLHVQQGACNLVEFASLPQ